MGAVLPLSLEGLMPIPLRDRLAGRESQVWEKSLTWQGAERIFIQAPSGTGKTTFIHMLYGIRKDFEGEASWATSSVKSMNAETWSAVRRESISIIFQDMRLFPALTAMENLEVKRVLTDTVSKAEVWDMMEVLGIADRANRPAATLSYGEQQRVAIIRALLQPFSWLLMDEPFSHLDKRNTHLAAALISEVTTRNGASFLLADLDDNALFPYTQKLSL